MKILDLPDDVFFIILHFFIIDSKAEGLIGLKTVSNILIFQALSKAVYPTYIPIQQVCKRIRQQCPDLYGSMLWRS